MPQNAIDNSGLIVAACSFNCNISGFTPVVNYVLDPVAKTLTATDASAFPSGDSFKKVIVRVLDDFGNEVKGSIAAAAGNTGAMSTATLNNSKALTIRATVISTNGLVADGGSYNFVYTTGTVANWDKQ
jgi:hypothetical protein